MPNVARTPQCTMLQFFKSIAVSHEGPGQGLVFTTSARRNCADNTFCLLNGHSFFPLLLLIFIPDQQGWMGSRPTIRRNDACGGKKNFSYMLNVVLSTCGAWNYFTDMRQQGEILATHWGWWWERWESTWIHHCILGCCTTPGPTLPLDFLWR